LKSEYLPVQYWRYVDDIWGIWEHGLDKLHEFHNLANSLHPRMKIELRFSNEQIECLNVNVSINTGHIKTDLFSIDTDKHNVLTCQLKPPQFSQKCNSVWIGG
jgi:hypothetical protein